MSQEYLKSVQADMAAARQPADKVARELYNQQASHAASPKVCKQRTSQPENHQASNQRDSKEFANHGHLGVIRSSCWTNVAPEWMSFDWLELSTRDWIWYFFLGVISEQFIFFSWRNLVTNSGFRQGRACFYATSGVAINHTVCVHSEYPQWPALGILRVTFGAQCGRDRSLNTTHIKSTNRKPNPKY